MTRVVIKSSSAQPVHLGMAALQQLRDAGVPVVGVLWPVRAEHGRLTSYGVGGDLVYEWTPDPSFEDLA